MRRVVVAISNQYCQTSLFKIMQLGCSAFLFTPFLSNFLLPSKGTKTTLETVEHVNGFPQVLQNARTTCDR